MQQMVYHHKLSNGLTLLGERMPWLESAAFTLMFPSGTCREPDSLPGLAGMTLELAQRGAGHFSSRDVVERLDYLGVERSTSQKMNSKKSDNPHFSNSPPSKMIPLKSVLKNSNTYDLANNSVDPPSDPSPASNPFPTVTA